MDAAAKVFRMRGYAEATLSEIAAMAGTQAGSLYYHFDSREHLVEEVLANSMIVLNEQVTTALAALPPDASVRVRIETTIRTHIRCILALDDYHTAYTKIIDQVPADVRERFLVFPRSYAKFWDNLLREARDQGDIRADLDQRLVRLLLIGAITWSLEWYDPNGPHTPDTIADHVIQIFFDGLRPAKTRRAMRRSNRIN